MSLKCWLRLSRAVCFGLWSFGLAAPVVSAAPVHLVDEPVVTHRRLENGTLLLDFGKATTFAGIYVDGDRERIPYEADAYLNQLSHYYCDADKQIARDSYDWLMERPTWPTEWAPHMVFMAHATLFPLAFGLVPEGCREAAVEFLKTKGKVIEPVERDGALSVELKTPGQHRIVHTQRHEER